MSDNDGKKTLGVRGGGSRPGNVKQSFSHGRTKNVVVETKRKRVVVPKSGSGKAGGGAGSVGDPSKRPAGITDAEMDRRLKAVQAANARAAQEEAQREADEPAHLWAGVSTEVRQTIASAAVQSAGIFACAS